jgi:archaeosine-15-forming tRNA-guanine transglycosylase
VKKVSKCDENCVEKIKRQPNFYAKKGEVRSVFFTNKPIILLVYKEAYLMLTIKAVKNVFLTRHEKYKINSDRKNES